MGCRVLWFGGLRLQGLGFRFQSQVSEASLILPSSSGLQEDSGPIIAEKLA